MTELNSLRADVADSARQLKLVLEKMEENAAVIEKLRVRQERGNTNQRHALDGITESILELTDILTQPRKSPQLRIYTLEDLRERWRARRSHDPNIMTAEL